MNKEVLELLNEQIWLENHSSNYYLNLAIEFETQGFKGLSTFFFNQSDEETTHKLKLIHYIIERGSKPILPRYNYIEPYEETFDVLFHFSNSLVQEKKISNHVSKVIYKCREVQDIMTDNFMQWYVTEQLEEEAVAKTLLDKLTIIGDDKSGHYLFDRDINSIVSSASTDKE